MEAKEKEILERLEAWARQFAASLSSRTLDKLLDELDKIRKEVRKSESHL